LRVYNAGILVEFSALGLSDWSIPSPPSPGRESCQSTGMPAGAGRQTSCPCYLSDNPRNLAGSQPGRAVGIRRAVANGLEGSHHEAENESGRAFPSGSISESRINRRPVPYDWTSKAPI